MGEKSRSYDGYMEVYHCEHCDWYPPYDSRYIGLMPPSYIKICPKCGSKIVSNVGRYYYENYTRFLFMKESKRIGYLLKKDDGEPVPPPVRISGGMS